MKGDKILIKLEYYENAKKIVNFLSHLLTTNGKIVISVSGESGSGKSVTAICLQQSLEEKNYPTVILHQDDYFLLPPKTNHNNRLKNIDNVGIKEVNTNLLNDHIQKFKQHTTEDFLKPIVDYNEDKINTEKVSFADKKILIVEGTYATILDNIDFKIFINRTYKDTYKARKERARDEDSPFIESVLQIEHNIINNHLKYADLIIQKDYSICIPQKL